MSRVVVVKAKDILSQTGEAKQRRLESLYRTGLQTLIQGGNLKECCLSIFDRKDRVGIKINTIGGRKLSTLPDVSLCLANLISEAGLSQENIIVWDRTNRELNQAGYRLNLNHKGIKVFGTDANGVDYERDLISYLNIGSLFSQIQSRYTSSSVSLAILKDHGLAGITASMKNYFGAIHNPNKYHDTNCNPFVAELFDTDLIKKKHRLSVIDALIVQYHRGPSYHSKWADEYEALIFSLDPVAADAVGCKIIEDLRSRNGLISLKEENREPAYLQTAEKMGLGKARLEEIQIIEKAV